jgi:hypothetical protein
MVISVSVILWAVLALIVVGVVVFLLISKPSLHRDWSPDQVLMPRIDFLDDGKIHIRNIRNINYRTTRDYDLDHYDREINIDDLDSAWLVISPFASLGAAHAFLSFGFTDGTFMAISIEIRRKKGQKFNPVKAFMRQFEMMYVLADELDVIRVRTNCIKYTVRLFPVQAEKSTIQAVFIDVLKRAEKLGKKPEFYNTLWNNCTTNIIKHTRRFSQKPIPFWNIRYLFPENLDQIAYRLNIIDTHLSYDAAREHFDITAHAQAADGLPDFSKAIRAHITTRPVV